MNTLIDLLETSAHNFADDSALASRIGLRTHTWSYADLWYQVNIAAADLRHRFGYRPGDRVLMVGENSPYLVIAFLAAIRARLILVPLDPSSAPAFVRQVAEDTEAVGLIGDLRSTPPAGLTQVALDQLGLDARAVLEDRPSPHEIIEVVYTSGTTGNPKGVVLTHENVLANIVSTSRIISAHQRWRMLSILPLSHMFEQTVGTLTPLYLGGTLYYIPALKSSFILKAFQRHHITSMAIVPQVLELLLRGIERQVEMRGKTKQWHRLQQIAQFLPLRARRLLFKNVHKRFGNALTFFVTGGASMKPELAEPWERLGVRVLQGYGTTECAPVIAANTLEHRRSDSVGRPIAGVEVRLSQDGEIQVRGPSVFQGYWRNPEATRAAFTGDGWYRTGDIAEQNQNGDLFIKGRNKDMIALPNGLNVFPEDVEAAAKAEPGVSDCIVLGLPDSSGNTRVTAVLILEPDASRSAKDIAQAANTHLAPSQRIVDIREWAESEFPRTRLGKVKRHEIREQICGVRESPAPAYQDAGAGDALTDLIVLICRITGADAGSITPASDLRLELGLTSLGEVELSVALEEAYGVVLDGTDLAAIATVGELLARVEQGGSPGEAIAFPGWSLRPWAVRLRSVLQHLLLFPLHRLLARPFEVAFTTPLAEPRTPAVYIANHCSHVDTLSIIRAIPPQHRARLAVAAASDYFYASPVIGALATAILNTFPFAREGATRASLEYCGDLVDQGWSILIYPEGTRSTSGRLLPFKRGIGLLAAGLEVPVVPIAVRGGYEILPKGRRRPRPGPVSVLFGAPQQADPDANPDALSLQLHGVMECLLETRPD